MRNALSGKTAAQAFQSHTVISRLNSIWFEKLVQFMMRIAAVMGKMVCNNPCIRFQHAAFPHSPQNKQVLSRTHVVRIVIRQEPERTVQDHSVELPFPKPLPDRFGKKSGIVGKIVNT